MYNIEHQQYETPLSPENDSCSDFQQEETDIADSESPHC